MIAIVFKMRTYGKFKHFGKEGTIENDQFSKWAVDEINLRTCALY